MEKKFESKIIFAPVLNTLQNYLEYSEVISNKRKSEIELPIISALFLVFLYSNSMTPISTFIIVIFLIFVGLI